MSDLETSSKKQKKQKKKKGKEKGLQVKEKGLQGNAIHNFYFSTTHVMSIIYIYYGLYQEIVRLLFPN